MFQKKNRFITGGQTLLFFYCLFLVNTAATIAQTPAPVNPAEADRYRFLEQAAFGPTTASNTRLSQIGFEAWIAEQAAKSYPSTAYPNLPAKSSDKNQGCPATLPDAQRFRCDLDHYSPYLLQRWYFTDALYGDAQLRRKTAWALSKIWVVAANKTEQARWHLEYLKILDKHAFGNYRDLMRAMTLNAAMGNYLDAMQNTRTSPNENYAREILQLFSIGTDELNADGTLKLDAGGNRIPTYDQENLQNLTRVLTGWGLCSQRTATGCPNARAGIPNYIDPMTLNIGTTRPSAASPGNHDIAAKTLLDYPGAVHTSIAACANCTDGTNDLVDIKNYADDSLNKALENIYQHPNVAPFVSRRLIQHFVTGNPSPAYVGRVAAVFDQNRRSPNQMLEVIKAILLDAEARGAEKTAHDYGKLREPFEFAANFLRAFGVKSANSASSCRGRSDGYISPHVAQMGQELLSPPSVFSYYSPEYALPGSNVVAPEFGIFDTETTLHRSNFVHLLTFAWIFYQENDPYAVVPCGTAINLTEAKNWAAADATANTLIENLNKKLLHGTMSAEMKSDLREAIVGDNPNQPVIPAWDSLARAKQAVYLIATSSQFQIQR